MHMTFAISLHTNWSESKKLLTIDENSKIYRFCFVNIKIFNDRSFALINCFVKDFFLIIQFLWQNFWKLRILKKFNNKFFFDLGRQCKYLELEKPSSIDFEMPIQKRLPNNILEGWAKRNPPLGLIGLIVRTWN